MIDSWKDTEVTWRTETSACIHFHGCDALDGFYSRNGQVGSIQVVARPTSSPALIEDQGSGPVADYSEECETILTSTILTSTIRVTLKRLMPATTYRVTVLVTAAGVRRSDCTRTWQLRTQVRTCHSVCILRCTSRSTAALEVAFVLATSMSYDSATSDPICQDETTSAAMGRAAPWRPEVELYDACSGAPIIVESVAETRCAEDTRLVCLSKLPQGSVIALRARAVYSPSTEAPCRATYGWWSSFAIVALLPPFTATLQSDDPCSAWLSVHHPMGPSNTPCTLSDLCSRLEQQLHFAPDDAALWRRLSPRFRGQSPAQLSQLLRPCTLSVSRSLSVAVRLVDRASFLLSHSTAHRPHSANSTHETESDEVDSLSGSDDDGNRSIADLERSRARDGEMKIHTVNGKQMVTNLRPATQYVAEFEAVHIFSSGRVICDAIEMVTFRTPALVSRKTTTAPLASPLGNTSLASRLHPVSADLKHDAVSGDFPPLVGENEDAFADEPPAIRALRVADVVAQGLAVRDIDDHSVEFAWDAPLIDTGLPKPRRNVFFVRIACLPRGQLHPPPSVVLPSDGGTFAAKSSAPNLETLLSQTQTNRHVLRHGGTLWRRTTKSSVDDREASVTDDLIIVSTEASFRLPQLHSDRRYWVSVMSLAVRLTAFYSSSCPIASVEEWRRQALRSEWHTPHRPVALLTLRRADLEVCTYEQGCVWLRFRPGTVAAEVKSVADMSAERRRSLMAMLDFCDGAPADHQWQRYQNRLSVQVIDADSSAHGWETTLSLTQCWPLEEYPFRLDGFRRNAKYTVHPRLSQLESATFGSDSGRSIRLTLCDSHIQEYSVNHNERMIHLHFKLPETNLAGYRAADRHHAEPVIDNILELSSESDAHSEDTGASPRDAGPFALGFVEVTDTLRNPNRHITVPLQPDELCKGSVALQQLLPSRYLFVVRLCLIGTARGRRISQLPPSRIVDTLPFAASLYHKWRGSSEALVTIVPSFAVIPLSVGSNFIVATAVVPSTAPAEDGVHGLCAMAHQQARAVSIRRRSTKAYDAGDVELFAEPVHLSDRLRPPRLVSDAASGMPDEDILRICRIQHARRRTAFTAADVVKGDHVHPQEAPSSDVPSSGTPEPTLPCLALLEHLVGAVQFEVSHSDNVRFDVAEWRGSVTPDEQGHAADLSVGPCETLIAGLPTGSPWVTLRARVAPKWRDRLGHRDVPFTWSEPSAPLRFTLAPPPRISCTAVSERSITFAFDVPGLTGLRPTTVHVEWGAPHRIKGLPVPELNRHRRSVELPEDPSNTQFEERQPSLFACNGPLEILVSLDAGDRRASTCAITLPYYVTSAVVHGLSPGLRYTAKFRQLAPLSVRGGIPSATAESIGLWSNITAPRTLCDIAAFVDLLGSDYCGVTLVQVPTAGATAAAPGATVSSSYASAEAQRECDVIEEVDLVAGYQSCLHRVYHRDEQHTTGDRAGDVSDYTNIPETDDSYALEQIGGVTDFTSNGVEPTLFNGLLPGAEYQISGRSRLLDGTCGEWTTLTRFHTKPLLTLHLHHLLQDVALGWWEQRVAPPVQCINAEQQSRTGRLQRAFLCDAVTVEIRMRGIFLDVDQRPLLEPFDEVIHSPDRVTSSRLLVLNAPSSPPTEAAADAPIKLTAGQVWTVHGLVPGAVYEAQTRYQDVNGRWCVWSEITRFRTLPMVYALVPIVGESFAIVRCIHRDQRTSLPPAAAVPRVHDETRHHGIIEGQRMDHVADLHFDATVALSSAVDFHCKTRDTFLTVVNDAITHRRISIDHDHRRDGESFMFTGLAPEVSYTVLLRCRYQCPTVSGPDRDTSTGTILRHKLKMAFENLRHSAWADVVTFTTLPPIAQRVECVTTDCVLLYLYRKRRHAARPLDEDHFHQAVSYSFTVNNMPLPIDKKVPIPPSRRHCDDEEEGTVARILLTDLAPDTEYEVCVTAHCNVASVHRAVRDAACGARPGLFVQNWDMRRPRTGYGWIGFSVARAVGFDATQDTPSLAEEVMPSLKLDVCRLTSVCCLPRRPLAPVLYSMQNGEIVLWFSRDVPDPSAPYPINLFPRRHAVRLNELVLRAPNDSVEDASTVSLGDVVSDASERTLAEQQLSILASIYDDYPVRAHELNQQAHLLLSAGANGVVVSVERLRRYSLSRNAPQDSEGSRGSAAVVTTPESQREVQRSERSESAEALFFEVQAAVIDEAIDWQSNFVTITTVESPYVRLRLPHMALNRPELFAVRVRCVATDGRGTEHRRSLWSPCCSWRRPRPPPSVSDARLTCDPVTRSATIEFDFADELHAYNQLRFCIEDSGGADSAVPTSKAVVSDVLAIGEGSPVTVTELLPEHTYRLGIRTLTSFGPSASVYALPPFQLPVVIRHPLVPQLDAASSAPREAPSAHVLEDSKWSWPFPLAPDIADDYPPPQPTIFHFPKAPADRRECGRLQSLNGSDALLPSPASLLYRSKIRSATAAVHSKLQTKNCQEEDGHRRRREMSGARATKVDCGANVSRCCVPEKTLESQTDPLAAELHLLLQHSQSLTRYHAASNTIGCDASHRSPSLSSSVTVRPHSARRPSRTTHDSKRPSEVKEHFLC